MFDLREYSEEVNPRKMMVAVGTHCSIFHSNPVSVQADFVKQPDVFINDGTASPFR
jgi:hypothetical protein